MYRILDLDRTVETEVAGGNNARCWTGQRKLQKTLYPVEDAGRYRGCWTGLNVNVNARCAPVEAPHRSNGYIFGKKTIDARYWTARY